MTERKPAYAGNRRGPKVKSGYYHAIAIRVTDRATFDYLATLTPEQRGEAIMKGMAIVTGKGGSDA